MLNRTLLFVALCCFAMPLFGQADFDSPGQVHVSKLEFLGKTKPLRELVEMPTTNAENLKIIKRIAPRLLETSAIYKNFSPNHPSRSVSQTIH